MLLLPIDRGLFPERNFALADEAIGLKEALENAFPKLQFILDRPHLKEHLYTGVEAMEFPEKLKRKDSGLEEGNERRHSKVTRMGRNSLTEKSHC